MSIATTTNDNKAMIEKQDMILRKLPKRHLVPSLSSESSVRLTSRQSHPPPFRWFSVARWLSRSCRRGISPMSGQLKKNPEFDNYTKLQQQSCTVSQPHSFLGEVSGQQENDSCAPFGVIMNVDRSLHVATSTDSTIGQGSHASSDFVDYHGYSTCYKGTHDGPFIALSSPGILSNGFCSQLLPNDEMVNNMKAENVELNADITCMSSGMPSSTKSVRVVVDEDEHLDLQTNFLRRVGHCPKDLSAVCASPPGYNRNFSGGISRIQN